jgi:hypothetical protein
METNKANQKGCTVKTIYLFLSAVLTIALTSPLFGRDNLADSTKTDMKQPDLSSMMGKPTVDTTVGGLHMKVWLMTQDQHREMMMHAETEGEIGLMELTGIDHAEMTTAKDMKGMPRDSVGIKASSISTDNDTVDTIQGSRSMNKAMMAGTHHIVLDVTERASGKEIAGTGARVLIESPSKKSSSIDLKSMMEDFGGTLTLNEKGEYRFTVNVTFGGITKTTRFQYAVK